MLNGDNCVFTATLLSRRIRSSSSVLCTADGGAGYMAHSTASHQDLLHQCDSGGFSSWLIGRGTDDLATSERRELQCGGGIERGGVGGQLDSG